MCWFHSNLCGDRSHPVLLFAIEKELTSCSLAAVPKLLPLHMLSKFYVSVVLVPVLVLVLVLSRSTLATHLSR